MQVKKCSIQFLQVLKLYRSEAILIISNNIMMVINGFIILSPFLSAIVEPSRLPATPLNAVKIARGKRILLLYQKTRSDPKLLPRLQSLAVPDAVIRLSPMIELKLIVINVPVPGPKSPS